MAKITCTKRPFKVVKIIDEYNVVINCGIEHGVACGDTFEIYAPGVEVIDPDTQKSLGALEFVKATIVARAVYPKMAACTSKDFVSIALSGIAKNLAARPVELNVDSEEISGGYDDVIRVGDLVRKIETKKSEENDAVRVPLPSPED